MIHIYDNNLKFMTSVFLIIDGQYNFFYNNITWAFNSFITILLFFFLNHLL